MKKFDFASLAFKKDQRRKQCYIYTPKPHARNKDVIILGHIVLNKGDISVSSFIEILMLINVPVWLTVKSYSWSG